MSYDNHRVAELVAPIAALPGEQWSLSPGDVVVFRGDQRHSYRNPGKRTAVGYSVVLPVPGV